MRKSMPIPTDNSTPEDWLAYANWLLNVENKRLLKKANAYHEAHNYIAEQDFLFEVEENEKEANIINHAYTPIAEYDSLMNGNAFRSSKKAQRRKANKKYHKADRKHGKNYLKRNNLQKLSVENAKFFHNKKAMEIAIDNGKWIYTGKDGNNFWSKVWYTRHKKNRNDRLNSAIKAREEEYITEF